MAVETFEHAGFSVRIEVDSDPSSPREYDNIAILACWHRRARLGDRQIEHCSEDELRGMVEAGGDELLAVLPLYLYDHSGYTMRTTPFECRWDSGQVGWAYVTRASALRMGCVGSEPFDDYIRQEVDAYDKFLTGQVYGYVVEDEDGDHVDSCWGYIGDLEYVRGEARGAADCAAKRRADTEAVDHREDWPYDADGYYSYSSPRRDRDREDFHSDG